MPTAIVDTRGRTLRKAKCLICKQTIVVIRHPDDCSVPKKELWTEKIRYFAIHLVDMKDFMEALTSKSEFEQYRASLEYKCKQKITSKA